MAGLRVDELLLATEPTAFLERDSRSKFFAGGNIVATTLQRVINTGNPLRKLRNPQPPLPREMTSPPAPLKPRTGLASIIRLLSEPKRFQEKELFDSRSAEAIMSLQHEIRDQESILTRSSHQHWVIGSSHQQPIAGYPSSVVAKTSRIPARGRNGKHTMSRKDPPTYQYDPQRCKKRSSKNFLI